MPTRAIANYTAANILDLVSRPQNCEEHDMTMRFRDVSILEGWGLLWPFLLIACGGTESVPEDLDFVSSGQTTATVHTNGDKTWHFDKPYITNQHIRECWFK